MSPMELAIIISAYSKLDEITRAQRQIDKVQKEIRQVNRTANQSVSVFKRVQNAIKRAFDPRTIEDFKNRIGDLGEKILVGLGVQQAIEKTMGAFAELESAKIGMEVAFMEKGGRLPAQELEKINKLAIELGNKLPGTTADFYRLARALKEQGLSTKAIAQGALEASAYLGALFKVPYEEAGIMTAKFQEAFRVPEKQLVRFTDLIQRSKFAFGLELQDIYYSVKYFSAQLNTLGITGMENAKKVMAWMGVLAGKGLEGSTAGTAIANVLNALTKLREPPEEVQRILSSYGVELKVFDEQGKFRGLDAFFKEIQKLKALTQEEQLTVLQKLFGEEGARAIAPLLNDVNALSDALQKIQRQADLNTRIERLLSGLSAKWEAFTGTLTNVFAQLGSYLAPTAKEILDTLNNFLSSLQLFIDEHKTIATVGMHAIAVMLLFAGTLTTLGAVSWGALQVWSITVQGLKTLSWITNLTRIRFVALKVAMLSFSAVKTISVVLFLLYQGFYALSYIIYTRYIRAISLAKVQTLALMSLSKVRAVFLALATAVRTFSLALLTNPITLIATGIALAGYLIYKNWEKVKAFFIGFSRGLGNAFAPLIETIKSLSSAFSPLKAVLSPVIELAGRALRAIGRFLGIVDSGSEDLKRFASIGEKVGYVVGMVLSTPFKIALIPIRLLVSAVNFLSSNWKKALSVFLWLSPITAPITAFKKLLGYLKSLNLFEAGRKIILSLWEGIKSVALKPVEAIKSITQKIRNFLPFSPAKEGPLKDLHLTGYRLIQTIARGVNPAPLQKALTSALALSFVIPYSPAKEVKATARERERSTYNITITLNVNAPMDRKTQEKVSQDIYRAVLKALKKAEEERERGTYVDLD